MNDSPAAERCTACGQGVNPEWRPPVYCAGRPLSGTGVWRAALDDGLCERCARRLATARQRRSARLALDRRLEQLMGGARPAREFTFARFEVEAANRQAFEHARRFNPVRENLYLWGECGVGKTHLAYAAGRRAVEAGRSALFLTAPAILRQVRMKEPDEEARAILRLIRVDVLVLDDLGMGTDTPYSRQILQEILDGRLYQDHGGLVITSKYSLDQLAAKLGEDSIPSRLARLCIFSFVGGRDHRLPA